MQFVNHFEFEFMKPEALSAIKLLQESWAMFQLSQKQNVEKAMDKQDNQSKEEN